MNINLIEGKVIAPEGMRVGIVASRFNSFIVEKLLEGAVDGLVRHGVEEKNIDACWVPGAFEIPAVAQRMADCGKYDVGYAVKLCAECRLRMHFPRDVSIGNIRQAAKNIQHIKRNGERPEQQEKRRENYPQNSDRICHFNPSAAFFIQ